MKSMFIFLLIIVLISINRVVIAQVPTAGLVAYYPFSGNANDSSGNGYNGTVIGATLIPDRFGNPNSAYSFNGVSDYIDLCNYVSNLNFHQPASISFWVWVNGEYDQCSTIYSIDDGNLSDYGSNIFIGNNCTSTLNNELITVFQGSTLSNHYTAGYTTTNRGLLYNSNWHNIVIVYNDTLTTAYLDNNLYSLTCNWGTNNGQYGNLTIAIKAYLGARYINGIGGFLNGWLDDVRIYNVALNASQVDSLYNEIVTNVGNVTNNIYTINIYPNPTKEWLKITNTEKGDIHIYNVLGEEVLSTKCNEGNVSINVSNLSEGNYIVKIVSQKNVVVKQLIIDN